MPGWLKVTLLAAALLTTIAFVTGPLAALASRRRRTAASTGNKGGPAVTAGPVQQAARIVQADYNRLVVTYSVPDDTVYLLTPPGQDPQAVLRAARLVLPEDSYQELAGHLGVPPGGPLE